jgi:hypothetical protein
MEARADAAHQRSQRNAADEAWKVIAAGGDSASIPRKLWSSMDGRDQMAILSHEKAAVSESKIETDWQTYYALRELSIDNPEKFQATDLRRYFDKLGETERKQLIDRQTTVAKTPDALTDVVTTDKQISIASALLDLKAEKKAKFESAATNAITAEQRRLGRKPTQEERQAVIDRLILDGEVEVPGALIDPDRRLYEIQGTEDEKFFVPEGYHDIPDSERALIEKALRNKGRKVTPLTVTELYNKKQAR